ncbi:hypothetical protein GCM10023311_26640 [Flaviramulus aquimarinus]|uniref:GH16 domain-containing protein n=1 Tax=Flaviramulus aquimarinus TaxID=1170456 RepID=A0ABP9FEF7_9FLAO
MKSLQKIKNNASLYSLLAISIGCFYSCEESVDDLEARGTEWNLVWSDEFDLDGAVDDTKWTHEIGDGSDQGIPGWGNNELQSYTANSDNSIVENGVLKLKARNSPYTSARIKTQGLFSQTYGRFEARIKTPFGKGIWPAFWLLGENIETVGWPQCGEIDIMELRGQEPQVAHGSLHGPGNYGGSPLSRSFTLEQDRFDKDFHVFAIEWGQDYIDYFVDGEVYQRITSNDVGEWVFNKPFFIILNIAIGGNYVGSPAHNTYFPQTMEVDYVRVYKETEL